jgi:hypothetical protein
MALQARLERMRKLVQVEADAISDRPASPEVVSHGTDSGSGGVSLENAQPEIPASKQGTSNETDTAIKGPRLATGENEERRFIWRKDAESSYNPGGLDSMRLSTAPPDTAGLAVTDLQRGDLVSARHGYSPINAIGKTPVYELLVRHVLTSYTNLFSKVSIQVLQERQRSHAKDCLYLLRRQENLEARVGPVSFT